MSWQAQLRQTGGSIPRVLRLVWRADPRGALGMGLLSILVGTVPPAVALTKKFMIDDLVRFVQAGTSGWAGLSSLVPLLGLIFLFQLVFNASVQGRLLAEKNLRARLTLHINTSIMEKAQSLDLGHFEDPDFYDKLQNAQAEADQRALSVLVLCSQLLQIGVTFAINLVLLFTFSPWLVVIFFLATVPSFALQNRYGRLNFRLLSGMAPERRRMLYLKELLTVDRYFKEVRLFNMGGRFIRQYIAEFWPMFRADMQLAKRRSAVSVAWGTVGVGGYLGAVSWIIYRAIEQTISFGDAVLYFEIFEQSHYLTQEMLQTVLRLNENSLFVENYFAFMALESQVRTPAEPKTPPQQLSTGIELRNVSFCYPNQSTWALRDINLTIHPGESLALVGLNGAGKTTLIKLLTRLYDPTDGVILVDGVDLRQLDMAAWRAKIGVIFQDFARYQMTATENIGLANVAALDDPAQIVAAAKKGGAHTHLTTLPDGYNTVLGTWFANGRELSLGQWQKVALSRAFLRDSEILILDEPTAALDAEQEFETFARFGQLTAGKIAILISHRFGTVRMADRIAVINDGKLVELGNHDELIAHGGMYAHLFSLQAQGYRP